MLIAMLCTPRGGEVNIHERRRDMCLQIGEVYSVIASQQFYFIKLSSFLALHLSGCLSELLVDCDHIVQQKVKVGTNCYTLPYDSIGRVSYIRIYLCYFCFR